MTQTIFITGASTGLGRATALLFSGRGWKVIATMRHPEKESELGTRAGVTLLPLDVTKPAQIKEAAAKALALGKGVILLSPHAGCFELLGPVYSSRYRSTVLFRPPRIAWLQEWIIGMRSREQLTMAPANQSGVRTLVKTLLRGNTIGILPDQVPTDGEGVWAPFFGKPAYTMTLVQRLQKLSGATIFILGAKRNNIGQGYTLKYKKLEQPLPEDDIAAATVINQEMEAMIMQMPEQYLWGYNRYKAPKNKKTQERAEKSA
jgi:KDO2-lipid IV(A) lauroyltransferase